MSPKSTSRRAAVEQARETRERNRPNAQHDATALTARSKQSRPAIPKSKERRASAWMMVAPAGERAGTKRASQGSAPASKRPRTGSPPRGSTDNVQEVRGRAAAGRPPAARPASRSRVPLGSQDINLHSDDDQEPEVVQPPKHRRPPPRVHDDVEEGMYEDEDHGPRISVDEGREEVEVEQPDDGEVDVEHEYPTIYEDTAQAGFDPSHLFDDEAVGTDTAERSRGRPRIEGRRALQRRAEEPEVHDDPSQSPQPPIPSPSHGPSTSHVKPRWPAYTDIVGSTRDLSLKQQSVELRTVLNASEDRMQYDILFDNAFPDKTTMVPYVRGVIIKAAEELGIHAIADRARRDPAYAVSLNRHFDTRMATFRRPFKVAAYNKVVLSYALDLETPSQIAARVNQLAPTHTYINGTKADGTPDGGKCFRHPCITSVLQTAIFAREMSHFIKRFPVYNNQPELPVSTVALACAAIYVALSEWQSGTWGQQSFSSAAAQDEYEAHCRTLNTIKATQPHKFHHLMSTLYTCASQNVHQRHRVSENDIMAVIDIDAMEG
ncbi:hypothetical protein EV715DRAFT_298041 [Schizophyllum commune]